MEGAVAVQSTDQMAGSAAYADYAEDEERGFGWVAFAGVLLLILGTLNTIEGMGKSNPVIAEELLLTKRTVEKNLNAIFLKLGGGRADDVSKRVKAALIFLAETHTSPVA
jgi:hypothetical protein